MNNVNETIRSSAASTFDDKKTWLNKKNFTLGQAIWTKLFEENNFYLSALSLMVYFALENRYIGDLNCWIFGKNEYFWILIRNFEIVKIRKLEEFMLYCEGR